MNTAINGSTKRFRLGRTCDATTSSVRTLVLRSCIGLAIVRSSIRGHEPNDEAMAVEQEWTDFFHLLAFTCPCEQINLFPDGTRGRQVTRVVEGTLVAWVSGNALVACHLRHVHCDEYTEFLHLLHWLAPGRKRLLAHGHPASSSKT